MTWRFSNRNQGVPRDYFDGGTGADPRTTWTMRRDTDANRVLTLLRDGEPFWATDTDLLYVGDGTTLGGVLISGGGNDAFKVKVTSADTTGNYLQSKVVAGSNITITKNNPAANETLTFAVAAGVFGNVFGPEPAAGTDNALVRWDTTTGRLIQDGQIRESDTGGLTRVYSITGTNDAGGYATWADATVYVATNKVVALNAAGGLASYECILNHTSAIDRDWPGYGTDWETYWSPLDATMYVTGPVSFTDGAYFNLSVLRNVYGVTFRSQSGSSRVFVRAGNTITDSYNLNLPIEPPGAVGVSLMCQALSGDTADLFWSTPGLDQVLNYIWGESGQVLVTNGVDTIEWKNRPVFYRYWYVGQPYDEELVDSFIATQATSFAAAFSGSYATAVTASAGNVSYTVKKNGASVGTIVFNISATGSFTLAGGMTLAAGDRVDIYAPTTSDATLAGVRWTLVGKLTY